MYSPSSATVQDLLGQSQLTLLLFHETHLQQTKEPRAEIQINSNDTSI